MHKQDNTNRDTGLESIMESMYSNEAKECPKCGKVHPINASSCGTHEAIDDPDDQYNTAYQVHPDLDAAAGGSLIEWINKYTDSEGGEAFVQKFIQFIQATEGINPDDTGRIPHDIQ